MHLQPLAIGVLSALIACHAMPANTDPTIGPLTGAPELVCTGSAAAPVSAEHAALAPLVPSWSAIGSAAAAARQVPGCCAYALITNEYLSAIPPPPTAARTLALSSFETFRAASCGSASMLTAGGAL